MTVTQKILFGSPGTGKSYTIVNHYLPKLQIERESKNCIKTVFHPEYSYGDFMGKLLPLTNKDGKVTYHFYEGHFLRALAQAYKNMLDTEEGKETQNVVLIIDEINRGNSAAIFGTAFQLLDRESDGWSSYEINISELEFKKMLHLIGIEEETMTKKGKVIPVYEYEKIKNPLERIKVGDDLKIKIPPNLHIIATMNTSDNSIYFMDSAFKRRWDWEFIDIKRKDQNRFRESDQQVTNVINSREKWEKFVDAINAFIKSHSEKIRRIEDKQIGYYFLKCDFDNGEKINPELFRTKLMFFLWDSVFINDKKPLLDLLNETRADNLKIDKKKLVTFGDFIELFEEFFLQIKKRASI